MSVVSWISFKNLLLSALVIFRSKSALASHYCAENQTAVLGEQGIIKCNFPDNFDRVVWFEDVSGNNSFVISCMRPCDTKTGPGSRSKEYDIFQNGSLSISNVTACHEKSYEVIIYLTPAYFERATVVLKVHASPGVLLLALDGNGIHQHHYQSIKGNETLTCTINAARPPVQLECFEQTPNGDIVLELSENKVVANEDGTFNSLVSVDLSITTMGKMITSVVCKATWMQKLKEEGKLLLDNTGLESFSSEPKDVLYIEINRRAEMQCKGSRGFVNLWKKILPKIEPIGFISDGTTELVTNSKGIKITSEGSLIFTSPEVVQEGTYACVYSHGMQSEIYVTNVTMLIPPSPPYIQIKECEDTDHICTLQGSDHYQLDCSVSGVHPVVYLEWIASEGSEGKIEYHNQKLTTVKRGATYDVSLPVEYKLISEHSDCGDDVFIKCRMRGPVSLIVKNERTVKLTREACKEDHNKEGGVINIIHVVFATCFNFVFIVVLVMVVIACYCMKRATTPTKSEESIPMNTAFVQDKRTNYEARNSSTSLL